MSKNKIVEFKGTVKRRVWGSDTFKIYAMEVEDDEVKKNDLKKTKYNLISICGNIQELSVGLDFVVKAEETYTEKNGYTYKVINIKRDKPKSAEDMYLFLQEILTENQARVLYEAYPDIVDRVINNNLQDVDLNKTPGIKEYTFGLIKEKIVDNYALAELVAAFKGYLTLTMLKKIHDKYPSVEKVMNEIKKDGYKCLCALSGVGFIKADSILLELEKEKVIEFPYELKTSKQRCLACMMYQLEQNESNGHTHMDIIELRKTVMKLTPACSDHFVDCLKENVIYYDKDKMLCALKSTYQTEKYIAETMKDALNIHNKWNIDCSKYTEVDGFTLSDEQSRLTSLVCNNQVSILNGNAGAGKTASMKSVTQMCKENNKTFLLLSPSAKAAVVLSESTGEDASTIHKGLQYPDPETMGWGYNEEHKLPYDLVVIDEFSMVGIFLFSHVIDAIDFSRTKLLLIGDDAQLPSIEAGNMLYDFLSSPIIPKLTLTQIFRYLDGGIMKAATDTRNSKKYLFDEDPAVVTLGKEKDYTFINISDEIILKQTIALYKKLLSEEYQQKNNIVLTPMDIKILTAKNVGQFGTIIINNEIQKIANKKNYGTPTFMKFADRIFYVDDCVMQTSNNYHSKVYLGKDVKIDFSFDRHDNEVLIANGQTGVIKEINTQDQYCVIDFDGVLIQYSRSEMESVSLSYCYTCHKSQGSSIPVVILLSPRADVFMMNSNLSYVGITRSKKLCFHLGNRDTVNMCIKKKENFKRRTFMQDLLKTK